MPISRFGAVLLAKGQYIEYMHLLRDNFAQENLATVMCRNMVSVDWQGYLYDCDFNQMLDMSLCNKSANNSANKNTIEKKERMHIRQLANMDISGNEIQTGEHCYGCTAGQGSSCSGALSASAEPQALALMTT